ncbi:hypothetical protein C8R43DRAFT_610780 [Mycena crocata]|nr:hypothetical protein C8R43DRAFT_610780 [Mycena crocata]
METSLCIPPLFSPTMVQDDSESSDSDNQEQPPPPPKSKPRRTRDDVSGNKTFDSRTRTSRRPSERQDNINKENLQTTEQKLLKAQKDLEKAKRQLRKATNTETKDDDDMESEEQEEEDVDPGVTSFKSSIRAMQPLPAEAPRPTTVLRKRSDPKPPPKISSRAYLALPEIAAGPDTSPPASPRHYDDRVDDVPMDLDDVPPPPRGAAAATPRRATESHGDSHSHYDSTPATSTHDHRGRPAAPDTTTRKRHQQSSPAPAPPPKRKRKEPKFAEGFIIVAGIKSKAADYEPEVKALILRACNEYAVRILIMNAFPDSALQTQWGKECFRNACRAAQQFYSSTTRIITLITRRGSHTRSLIVQACRACFAAHYTFNQSSTSAAVMVSNSKLSEKLRASAAFHYKDTNERTGYGGNPILAQMRHSKLFEGKKSLGAIFATKFDPYPLATLALEFAAIEHCAKEWSTGKFISADFSEKETLEPYKTHLKDIQEWHSLNEQVVQNIRHKWFVRATRKLELPTTPDGASHLDSTQKDALRDELAGRTGETDSEPELEGGDP